MTRGTWDRILAAFGLLFVMGCAPKQPAIQVVETKGPPVRYFAEISGVQGSKSFSMPVAIAFDAANNAYIVDQGNDRIVKLNSALQFAAENGGYGLGINGLNRPVSIAGDGVNFFLLDQGNNRIVRSDYNLVFSDEVRFIANAELQRLGKVPALAYSRYGEMILLDPDNLKALVLDKDYGVKRELLPPGGFSRCSAIALDNEGGIYVYDRDLNVINIFDSYGNSRGKISVMEGALLGGFVVSNRLIIATDQRRGVVVILNRSGEVLETLAALESGGRALNAPTGIALRADSKLFVCDTGNNRIVVYDMAAAVP